jgi:pimeloyl-ACP methyl ester carboxylesterase
MVNNPEDTSAFGPPSIVELPTGGVVRAFSRGSRANPALALVNGFGLSVELWEPLARALEGSFYLVAWETRGLPATDTPFNPSQCGVSDQADDMEAVLRHFGVQEAVVVGWCSGCQVALRYAARPGNRLLGAVLLNGAYCLPSEWTACEQVKNMRAITPFCSRGPTQAQTYSTVLMESFKSGPSGGSKKAKPMPLAGVSESIRAMVIAPFSNGEALYRYACLQKSFFAEPTHGWLDGTDLPVLVVASEKDQIVSPSASREVARRLAGSELVVFPEGDHYLHFFDPTVAPMIGDFFERRVRPSRGVLSAGHAPLKEQIR